MPSYDRIPTLPYLTGPCQRFSNIGNHGPFTRLAWRLREGLGLRSRVRALFTRQTKPADARPRLGAPSRFAEGDWVRVLDADAIRETLDARSRLGGLEFGDQQWSSCGGSYRVSKVVRRIIDDDGRMRAVSRTVLLDDVHCGGDHDAVGCARRCPMMFRDAWLEPGSPPDPLPAPAPEVLLTALGAPRYARVRSVGEIEATLDPLGRRGGLLFMPEMARFAGHRFPITKRLHRVWELEVWVDVPDPVYILDGPRCTGAVLRAQGPCHRACHLLWHADWLELEPDLSPPTPPDRDRAAAEGS